MTLNLEPISRGDVADRAAGPAPGADRVLGLAGSLNLRDVGGYPAADGRRIRRRTLLRSAAMHGLGDQARAVFAQLPVRTVIDLREDAEAGQEPNALGRLPISTKRIPIFSDGPVQAPSPAGRTTPGDEPGSGAAAADGARAALAAGAGTTLGDIYDFILDNRGARLTAAVLELAVPGALPAIVHCSAGKDRTGLTIMLVLGLVGVRDDVIAADYAMSAALLGEEVQAALRRLAGAGAGDAELPADLLSSPPELILRSLAKVRASHGGARGYLLAHGAPAERLDALTEALLAAG
jgi:protein-tyrosine phosphatase